MRGGGAQGGGCGSQARVRVQASDGHGGSRWPGVRPNGGWEECRGLSGQPTHLGSSFKVPD